jgi:germination protein M
MRKIVCITAVCLIIIAAVAGCSILRKLTGVDDVGIASSILLSEEVAGQLQDKVPIRLYFADKENEKLRIEIRYIPKSEAMKSVNNLAGIIVDELIKGPVKTSLLNATIPEGTSRIGSVKIEEGIATVNLSKEFVENHPGGKNAEQLTIFSIVNSLTELKEIQKVRFTIEGQLREDYKGSFKFDMPFPRTASIISREAPVSNIIENEPEAEEASNIRSSDAGEDISEAGSDENSGENDNLYLDILN